MWITLLALDIAVILTAPAVLGLAATVVLAAAWCIRIDREQHAVQLIDSEEAALNL